MATLGYCKISPGARAPVKTTMDAAGYDLHSLEDQVLPARGRILVHTGLRLFFPEGSYGRIAARSGLARDHGLDVGGGVIDRDYTGEVCVILFNHSEVDFTIIGGTRIAQVIVEEYKSCLLQEIQLNADGRPKRKKARMSCSGAHRGSQGFGSSGLN